MTGRIENLFPRRLALVLAVPEFIDDIRKLWRS